MDKYYIIVKGPAEKIIQSTKGCLKVLCAPIAILTTYLPQYLLGLVQTPLGRYSLDS